MTYDYLKGRPELLLLDCISGSQAYNLATATSDIDKKGIFILPKKEFFGFDYQQQVSNASNDEVYFEIGRFMELLLKNNPNILELLSSPEGQILYKHPLIEQIKPADFLSKLCLDTFAGYAQTQIKKAKGLNKKINRPIDRERKVVTDFCYVIDGNGSVPLNQWLKAKNLLQEDCGLNSVDHFRDVYLLYHKSQLKAGWFRGIVAGQESDDVQVSPVPKYLQPLATMNFNKDGYSVYCRTYREYIQWEQNRNQLRYESTLAHGQSYDAKNMMHTFRLLNMAEEIALYHEIRVHRNDRDFLLKIRSGAYRFEELMDMVEAKLEQVSVAYQTSTLPAEPDYTVAENILLNIRESYYS